MLRRTSLRINAVEGSGEGDGFADVVEAADPGYYSLDAHAEAGVGDAAVFAEVEVPLEGVEWAGCVLRCGTLGGRRSRRAGSRR